MNKEINSNYSIVSHINGLSDHDAQILVLRNINIRNQKVQPAVIIQLNETTITQFKLHLSEENWSSTFNEEPSFNNFLNEYLTIFNHSFPTKKYDNKHPNQGWLTKGIKISCHHKRDLYMLCKNTNNTKIKIHYKTYCKILTKVIKMAKRLHFNKLIKCSTNKSKTMWNLVKVETNTRVSNDKIPLTIKGKSITNLH